MNAYKSVPLFNGLFQNKSHFGLHVFPITIISHLTLCITGTLANSKDPDEMQHNSAFHQDLHCFAKIKTTCRGRKTSELRKLYLWPLSVHNGQSYTNQYTVKSRLSERQLSETTRLFEDDGQSRFFSLLSIAIKLPIIRISIIRKIQFFELIRRSRLKKLLLNNPSRFEVQKSRMVIMISLFGRVRFTHLSDIANKVATGN